VKSKKYFLVASIIQSFSGFLILPILLNNMPFIEYGKYLMIIFSAGLLSIFLNLGLNNVITAFYLDWKNELIKNHHIKILLILTYIQYVVLGSLIFFILNFLKLELLHTNIIIFYTLLVGVFQSVQLFWQTFFRMNDNALLYFISTMLYVILDFLFKIFYLKYFEFNLEIFILISALSSIVIYFLYSVYFIFSKDSENIKFNFQEVVCYYKFSLNMFSANLIGRVVSFLDKPIVVYLLGYEAFALYGLAQRFNGAVGGFRATLKNIWIADAIKNYKNNSILMLNRSILYSVFLVIMGMIFFLPFYFNYLVTQKVDNDFYLYVLYLLPLNILWILYYFNSIVVSITKNSVYMPRIQFYTSIVYLILLSNIYFNGIYGLIFALYTQIIFLTFFTFLYYKRDIQKKTLLLGESSFLIMLIFIIGGIYYG
jgi:O-antigen/teichoic acid export membrane protein